MREILGCVIGERHGTANSWLKTSRNSTIREPKWSEIPEQQADAKRNVGEKTCGGGET